jgi:hypothetical protein
MGVTNEYKKQQRLGWEQHRADREEPLEQIGSIEESVGTFHAQTTLQLGPAMRRSPAQKQDYQLQVCRGQAAPRIRTDHE